MAVLKALGETIFKMFAADLWLSLTTLAVIGLTALGLRAHLLPPALAPFLLAAGVAAALAVGVARGARRQVRPLPSRHACQAVAGARTMRPSLTRETAMAEAPDYKTWQCGTCGFLYDEADGLPEEGFAPGTRWADIPDTWVCPDCGMAKNQFEMVEI